MAGSLAGAHASPQLSLNLWIRKLMSLATQGICVNIGNTLEQNILYTHTCVTQTLTHQWNNCVPKMLFTCSKNDKSSSMNWLSSGYKNHKNIMQNFARLPFQIFSPTSSTNSTAIDIFRQGGKNTHTSLISTQTWGQLHFEVINYYYYYIQF